MSEGLDFIDGLERDLVAAAERRRDARRAARLARLRQRLGLRGGGLALLLFACVGVASAGATFAVLRAAVIPPPAARDVPREQRPAAGSARVSELRAPDPVAGRPPWTLRLARSSTGLVCTTVGQLVDGSFGLIGLDGRFRAYDERIVDACGEHVAGPHASLVGARVFAAPAPVDVRTVVNGIGGARLSGVTLVTASGRVTVPVGAGGAFVTALRGYPEDNALRVELRFAGGAVERHDFGVSPSVMPDPEGGRAWRVGNAIFPHASRRRCAIFEPSRAGRPRALSPAVCGASFRDEPLRPFFAVRRIEPGTGSWRGQFGGRGLWGDQPARTAVWGGFPDAVARVDVLAPGIRRRAAMTKRHMLLAVLPGRVDPRSVVVQVRWRDGRVERHRGDTNLVPPGRWR